MIHRIAERDLKTKFGMFKEVLYYDGQKESISLVIIENGAQKGKTGDGQFLKRGECVRI